MSRDRGRVVRDEPLPPERHPNPIPAQTIGPDNSGRGVLFLKIWGQYPALLFALIAFAAMQFIVLKVSDVGQTASKQVVKEKRGWARTPGAIKTEPGKDLVFFFGNSHGAAGIVPEIFDSISKNTVSYNLCLVGLQLPPHYFMLKDYLEKNPPPQYIVMEDIFEHGFAVESFPSYAVQGAGFWEAAQYAFYSKNWEIFWNYAVPSRLHWPEAVRYFSGKALKMMPQEIRQWHRNVYLNRFENTAVWGHNREYFYDSQFGNPEQMRSERLRMLRKNRGYYYIVEESVVGGKVTKPYLKELGIPIYESCEEYAASPGEGGKDFLTKNVGVPPGPSGKMIRSDSKAGESIQKKISIPDSAGPFFDDFFRLTQKYNIKIILIPPYVMRKFPERCGGANDRENKIREFLSAQPNVYYLPDAARSRQYDYPYFSDPSHLNPEGAEKYTRALAEYFMELTGK